MTPTEDQSGDAIAAQAPPVKRGTPNTSPVISMKDVPTAPPVARLVPVEPSATKPEPSTTATPAMKKPMAKPGMQAGRPVVVSVEDSRPSIDVNVGVQWKAPVLTDANFQQWSDYLWPTDEDLKWQKIRWHKSLSIAAKEAKELNRPILLWTMNGHPCGET